jgi:hypothetical protein
MTTLLQFTTNSQPQPQRSLQLVLIKSRVVRLSWSARFFMRAAESKMAESSSSRVSTFLL